MAMLSPKRVWDLSIDEARVAYEKIQLNNYVYAALEADLASSPPSSRRLTLKNLDLSESITSAMQHFLDLAPYVSHEDPTTLRIHYVYRAFQLFATFSELQRDQAETVLAMLAETAFLPVQIERRDNFPLWHHNIIRELTPRIENILACCLEDQDIRDFEDIWRFEFEPGEQQQETEMSFVLRFIPRIVQALIVLDENDYEPDKIARGWHYLESQMNEYEQETGIGGPGTGDLNIVNSGQLRYRNTVYLYGGDFFRRRGDHDTAKRWYLKDINNPVLPKHLSFYLTDMKTVERLLCAYQLDHSDPVDLKALIAESAFFILRNSSVYAKHILDTINSNSGIDLSQPMLTVGKQTHLYGGEPSREPFLFALLYRWMFYKQPPFSIPYGRTYEIS